MFSNKQKLLVALVGAAVAFLNAYFGPNEAWVTTVIALLTAAGVYQVPNREV